MTSSTSTEGPSAEPLWSIITVAFNSSHALRRFWSSRQPARGVEWIVVDNASTDDSAEVAQNLGARVIRLSKNLGFGAANNIGFHASTNEFVAFINPDVGVEYSDLPYIAHEIMKDGTALVAPQLINDDGSLQANGRGKPYLIHKILNRLRPQRLEGTYQIFAREGHIAEVSWLMGAAVVGKRERFLTLGPWDPYFFVYYEDSDLGLRNLAHGGSNKVLGSVKWHHGWARETAAPSLSAWKREIPSMVKFYARYPSLLAIPLRVGTGASR